MFPFNTCTAHVIILLRYPSIAYSAAAAATVNSIQFNFSSHEIEIESRLGVCVCVDMKALCLFTWDVRALKWCYKLCWIAVWYSRGMAENNKISKVKNFKLKYTKVKHWDQRQTLSFRSSFWLMSALIKVNSPILYTHLLFIFIFICILYWKMGNERSMNRIKCVFMRTYQSIIHFGGIYFG